MALGNQRRRSALAKSGGTALVLFGSAFVLIGGLVFLFFVGPLTRYFDSRNWVSTPATIEASSVQSHSGESTTYSIEVRYRYSYGGRTYTSDQYEFLRASSSGFDRKQRIVDGMPPGSSVTCYVNPKNPTEAVLNRSAWGIWFGLLPLAFVAFGLVFIRRGFRTKAMPPAGVQGNGRPDWLPVLKHRIEGGHVILAPAWTPLALFIGFVFVALFWNGITSVFVVQVVRSYLDGDPEWFQTFFLMPFVAVGLFLAGLAVRQLLAIFNPTIEMTLDRAVAVPGDGLQLEWQIRGNVGRLNKLTMRLIGTEAATYRRGTDTVTDRYVFKNLLIYESPVFSPIGAAKVEIPPDAMHSFKSSNNHIEWKIQVRGEVLRWPDLEADYEIIVMPKGTAHG